MDQMAEKIRENEAPGPLDERVPAGAPDTDTTSGEIKGCVGATGGEEGASPAIPAPELERLHSDLVAALKTVFDPEIPVDIYELGLIYRLEVDDDRNIEVDMTLTAPGCPVAGDM